MFSLEADTIQYDFGRGDGCLWGSTGEHWRRLRLLVATLDTSKPCGGWVVRPCRTMVAAVQHPWREAIIRTVR